MELHRMDWDTCGSSSPDNGLIRFDGYRMKEYVYDPSDSNSLDRSSHECVVTDSSGNIWTTAATGVDRFDPSTNKFIHYRYGTTEMGGRSIGCLLFDHLGMLWIGTSKGLDRLDPKTRKFTHYIHQDNDPNSLSCNEVRCLYEDRQGVLWIGTGWEFDPKIKEGGLNRFNRETGTFTRFLHNDNDPKSLCGDKVRALFEDSRGVFWVGTDGAGGLHIMDRKAGTFERLAYDPKHPEKLSRPALNTSQYWADHITFITEDCRGSIWIGTYYAGIARYDPRTNVMTYFNDFNQSDSSGFKAYSGWCAYSSKDGTLWISTEYDTTGKSIIYRVDPFQTGFSSISLGGEANKFYGEDDGTIWTSYGDKGLLRTNINWTNKKFYTYDSSNPHSINSNSLSMIKPDKNGWLWLGTFNGLCHFDTKTGNADRYLYSSKPIGGFGDTAVFNLLRVSDQELYFSSIKGLVVMNPDKGLVTLYTNDQSDTTSLTANPVTALLHDRSGKLWVGSFSGLNIMDRHTGKFSHYLAGSTIQSIFKDSRGIIWIGTNHGLYYGNDTTYSFTAVDEWGNDFRTRGISLNTEDKEGNLWGGTTEYVFRLHPGKHELCIYGKEFGLRCYR